MKQQESKSNWVMFGVLAPLAPKSRKFAQRMVKMIKN